jgi:hypothetical protein
LEVETWSGGGSERAYGPTGGERSTLKKMENAENIDYLAEFEERETEMDFSDRMTLLFLWTVAFPGCLVVLLVKAIQNYAKDDTKRDQTDHRGGGGGSHL